ncbi:coiled-coil domain-containing glutamate-rich protein 2 [Pangshura tecta]
MLAVGLCVLLLSCWHADSLPLSTQLSEEDEKVIKCITEVLADTLSKSSPGPVINNCLKILKEDERVLALLHRHYLLKELKELVHEENAHHHPSHGAWQETEEGPRGDELKKRDKPLQQTSAASETVKEKEGEARKEEYEKTEKIEEKVKEEKVSHGEDSTQVEEEAKEILEGEEEEEERKRRHEEARRASPKLRETRVPGASKKTGPPAKRHFSQEDSSEEDLPYHHGGWHHGGLEDWEQEEEEEEEEEEKRKGGPAKRVAEKASDEETAQFEAEEKGVKISDSQIHLRGDGRLWKEGEERHGHRHGPPGHPLKKRHHEDEAGHLKGKHHEEEEREAKDKERELERLEEIEHALKKVAEKLRELRRG